MATYGPSTMTLADRLLSADVVARVVAAELVRTAVDELSESRREHGTFVLTVADTLRGERLDKVEVLVARAPEEPWPVPEKGEFLALLQASGDGRWVLVHDSAFPIRGDEVRFDPAAGLTPAGGKAPAGSKVQRVPLKEVSAAIAARDRQAEVYAAAEKERETSSFRPEGRAVQEMPGDGLREWLDLEHGEGGRPGKPSAEPDGADEAV